MVGFPAPWANLNLRDIRFLHGNQPFGRFASAQIGMKESRQATAFLIK